MQRNPLPPDAATAQAVMDKHTGSLRMRRDDERTAAGHEIDHDKYVVATVIGVRARCCTV